MSSRVHIQLLQEKPSGPEKAFCYKVAKLRLYTDCVIPDLLDFEEICPDDDAQGSNNYVYDEPVNGEQVYLGPGWIGNQWRQVSCHSFSTGYQIVIEGIGAYWISADGANILCTMKEAKADFRLQIEAVLGPALIRVLAMQGTWALHASAIAFNDRVIALLGESGKGKSTLARRLHKRWVETGQRIGDDILPVSMSQDSVNALPHFPQLKIPSGQQPSIGVPERMPLAAVYVLERPPSDGGVEISSLSTQDGALALIRHTVAAQLFGPSLLAKQLDFCVHVATRIPVRKLIYPFGTGVFEEVQEALLDDIQSQYASQSV